MHFECPNCKQVIEFADRRPAFCSHCGQSLVDGNIHEAATQAYAHLDTDSERNHAITVDRPETVGDFRLVRQLGQGGMGVVYEAEQEKTGRRVALKLLSPGTTHSHEAMERFIREGRLAAAFSHPRSTFVFGASEQAGQPFITMELMPGRTLNDVSTEVGPMPVNRAVDYMLDVIEGLDAAHAAGVIHRDVKPSNCFIDSDGRVKIGDFGLSKSLVTDAGLTRTGAFMGTPLFAAPEQVRAGKIDERTDIYAVGATLFYLIARRGPFIGDPAAVIAQIASDPAPSLRSLMPAVPRDLDQVVAQTLQKDPDRRFLKVTELHRALQPFATGGMIPAPVGRRLGAYFLDTMMTGAVFGFLIGMVIFAAALVTSMGEAFSVGPSGVHTKSISIQSFLISSSQIVFFALMVSYFAICEAWTGKSFGKRMLGLRVVGGDGGRPGTGRAFLRATLVPGLMWLSMSFLFPIVYPSNSDATGRQFDPKQILIQQLLGPLTLIPMLLCLVTMRTRNGYRGLHDLASGTCVVQMRPGSAGSRLGDVPVIAPIAPSGNVPAFGPFRATGSLGKSGDAMILQASDETLNRRVWVFVRPLSASPVSTERAGVARAARPRWLQGGESGGARWDAFEAVLGSPLALAVSNGGELAWDRGRFLLLDLAEELVAASTDGTLPESLSLDHVWLDRDGRVKLLDVPIQPPEANQSRISKDSLADPLSAVGLLRAVAHQITLVEMPPVHAQEFVTELMRRPEEMDTLVWAAGQLREFATRTGTLTRSDRLVAVGVCAGSEYSLYQLPICLLMLAMLQLELFTDTVRLATVFVLGVGLPSAIGFWTRGGPVFQLLGIAVRRREGSPAGRMRCAWRNLVSWMPIMLAFSFNVAVLPKLMKAIQTNPSTFNTPDGPGENGQVISVSLRARSSSQTTRLTTGDGEQAILLSLLFMGSGCAVLLHAAGAVYAIARPNRGIQDLLAGTRLVPR